MKKTIILFLIVVFLLNGVSLAGPKKTNPKKTAGAVRVYRFDNLDIEGHIKSPHLMNFLKRIKNRFRSFHLPQQDFKKKIIDSKDADFLNN